MFGRVLIANRGEIALRVIRACRELDIETVCVYSEEDKDAIYLRYADEKFCIGPADSAHSYLHIPNIVAAAEIADVEAIHPGYGFLSENAHFADICADCHITWIGPKPETIRLLGDKSRARDLAKKAGVPTVPGSAGIVENEKQAREVVKEIGYPVLIKASAGGGGRGMRIAHNNISLMSAFHAARAEAEIAFKDSAVYIEKLIEKPRHVEFQILADNYGHIIHLGERDCSLQRRHQKLIEEAPSPVLTPKLRARMGEAAINICKAADYSNVGTVEFLLDKDMNFYFIEVNTRLQVEHPVTEMVTGVDIVRQQIRMAAGEELDLKQDDIKLTGCAIECRINAEDPSKGFKPSPGTITKYFPPGGTGVRVDSHVYSGFKISPKYDSLIAKLIVRRHNRSDAIVCMRRALEEYVIDGVPSTVSLYKDIFRHSNFLSAEIDTNWVENNF